jgi:signal transduction histidine kinase
MLAMMYCGFASAQKLVDSLEKAYKKNRQDTTLVRLLDAKALIKYVQVNTDSGMLCARQGLAISRGIHYKYGEVRSMADIALYLNTMGDLPGALRLCFETLPKAVAIKETYTIGQCYNTLGLTYHTLNEYKKSIDYYHKSLIYMLQSGVYGSAAVEYNNLSRSFLDLNMLDSALFYANKCYALDVEKHNYRSIGFALRNLGIIQYKKGDYTGAIDFFNKSLAQKGSKGNDYLHSEDLRRKAEAWQKLGNLDSCIGCAKQAYEEAKLAKDPSIIMDATSLLTNVFKAKNDYRQAYDYQQIMLMAQDSLFSQQKTMQIRNVEYNEQQRQQEMKAAEADYQNKLRFYALLTVIGVFVLIALFLLYSNQARKKANKLLHQQNEQIQAQHKTLEHTLSELKNTQTQLIQSAKMASLGELTAGVAHEIQNPLNFVNNFSEVNREMLEELKAESEKPKAEWDEKLIIELINDLVENEQKINHHGKRADAIVKGMLEHSRQSTGAKDFVDVNKLAKDYALLAYNGFLAKDKMFNIELVTHFDVDSGSKLFVTAQDIGRVLLNLLNNAFYSVYQQSKKAPPDYKPIVEINTFKENENIIIKVKDNGTGIPDTIKDKIIQPFFTTKPTGEGTGLGLSLSYDIVVNGHGGTIRYESVLNQGATFFVILPLPAGANVPG